jgi:hypothetical protein
MRWASSNKFAASLGGSSCLERGWQQQGDQGLTDTLQQLPLCCPLAAARIPDHVPAAAVAGAKGPMENPAKHLVYRPSTMQLLSILTTTVEVMPKVRLLQMVELAGLVQ